MSDVEILNSILVVEHLGIAAYDAALGSGLLDGAIAAAGRAFQTDHKQHAEIVSEQILVRDGMPLMPRDASDYAKSFPSLTTAAEIVAYAIQLEAAAARAYLATVTRFEDRSLALLGAEIGAVEAQHWAVLLGATGANPVPSPIIEVKAA
jgi:hypothetical protein